MTETATSDSDALANATIHERWVSAYRTPESQWFFEQAFDEIVRRLKPPADATILDAGCGTCAKSVLLARRGFKVVGTDFSTDALKLGAQAVAARGLQTQVVLREANLLDLPFRDGEFRYVLCWGVLMHVPQVEQALGELVRVLAPGGVLVLSEGNMHAVQAVALRWLKRLTGRGRARVVRTAAGLETLELTEHGALLTRQTDISWLLAQAGRMGLRLQTRLAGQFTEVYVLLPWRWARRVVHLVNHLWFHRVRLAGPAFGNILFFEKQS